MTQYFDKFWGNQSFRLADFKPDTAKDFGVTGHKQFRGRIEGDNFQIGADWMDQSMCREVAELVSSKQ